MMSTVCEQMQMLAEGYTEAWSSQSAASVAAFYALEGSLSV